LEFAGVSWATGKKRRQKRESRGGSPKDFAGEHISAKEKRGWQIGGDLRKEEHEPRWKKTKQKRSWDETVPIN